MWWYRLRPLLRFLGFCLGLGVVFLGWKCFLLRGPGWMAPAGRPVPALFAFHAAHFVRGLDYPKPVFMLLPDPAPRSSADAQLRLMGLWNGQDWTPKALALGGRKGRALELRAGELVLGELLEIGPARLERGATICEGKIRVDWDFAESLRELFRVREIVGLQPPHGLGLPGQGSVLTFRLGRSGLGWALLPSAPTGGRPAEHPIPAPEIRRAWLDWLF